MKRQPRQRGKGQYIEGFLAGQVVAYCEQVKAGSRLAGQINCPSVYMSKLITLVAQEGCKSAIERLNSRRVSLWIYRDKLAKRLVDHLQSAPTSELGIWSMGKLFGYADREIVDFIERSK